MTAAGTPHVTIDEKSRDRTIFDAGTARGGATAPVPVSGTVSPGARVAVRAVTASGNVLADWTEMPASGGLWAGVLVVPLSGEWVTLEATLL